MKYILIPFLIFAFSFAACEKKQEEKTKIPLEKAPAKIDTSEYRNRIQSYIDSASMYYEKAYADYEAKVPNEQIVATYKPYIQKYMVKVNDALLDLERLGVNEKINQSQYEQIVNNLNMTNVQAQSEMLNSLGISFR